MRLAGHKRLLLRRSFVEQAIKLVFPSPPYFEASYIKTSGLAQEITYACRVVQVTLVSFRDYRVGTSGTNEWEVFESDPNEAMTSLARSH